MSISSTISVFHTGVFKQERQRALSADRSRSRSPGNASRSRSDSITPRRHRSDLPSPMGGGDASSASMETGSLPPHPDRSLVLIPESVFSATKDDPRPTPEPVSIDERGESRLLRCRGCQLVVHASECCLWVDIWAHAIRIPMIGH